MHKKRYYFADFCVELLCEMPIKTSENFAEFIGGGNPNISFNVICGKLPEKTGKMLFSGELKTFFSDGENEYMYSSFYDGKSDGYIDYSCRVTGKNGNFLYIDYDEMWDSMVFDALNIPDILIRHKTALIHSSYIVHGGKAILFTADRQTGKSTQASLWEKYAGALVVNGDRASIKEKHGVMYACAVPFRGSSKVSLSENRPLRAIIVLGQSKENTIRRLSPSEAFVNLIGKLTYDTWNEESVEAASYMAAYAAENVEVYKYDCLPDESAVTFLRKELNI